LQALGALLDLGRLSRAPARFDESELDHLNARLLHDMPYADVAERLKGLGIEGGEAFWLAIRGNIGRLGDAKRWWAVVQGPVDLHPLDAAFQAAALESLPPAPWDHETWAQWTAQIKAKTGLSGKALFMPLRQVLTGHEHGPELKALLPLIGPEQVRARLST